MLHKLHNPIQKCQLKFDSEAGVFSGYASVFNSVDKVGDTILPGAFKSSLDRRIKMFVNHKQHEVPVGDWVEMKEDDYGLKAVGQIDMNHKDGPTVYSALKRGAMDGLSIGFTAKSDDFTEQEEGGRLYKNLSLLETSIVSFPCEGKAVITDVKHIQELTSLKDFEDYLREACDLSRSMAKVFVSQFRDCVQRDAEGGRDEYAKQLLSTINALKDKLK